MNPKAGYFLDGMQSYQTPASRIVDIGVEIPKRRVSNEEIAELIQGPVKLKKALPSIMERTTGNNLRAYAPKGTVPSDLAVRAIMSLVKRTDLDINTVDTLIFASTDMDMMEPATANIVQHKLGLKRVNALDVSNACNSFLQAMNVANSLIATGAAHRVIICSGELGSAVCNYELGDVKELRVKMGGLTLGDAGAAMLLEAAQGDGIGIEEINLMSFGEHWRLCHVPEKLDWRQQGGALNPWFYLDMPELAVVAKRFTLNYLQQYSQLRTSDPKASITDQVDFFVPHQISRTMIEYVCFKEMKMDPEKVAITAHLYGNTASTAIPLALRWLMDNSRLSIGSGKDCLLYGAASGFGLGHIRVKL